LAQARERIAAVAGPFAPQVLAWTPGRSLEAMDQAGVQMAATSISSPGIWLGDGKAAAALARECNEYAAEMAARYAKRFAVLAVLPLPDVEAALNEIEYAYDTLNVAGIGLYTNYGGDWLGAPAFAPILDELNRRRAVVLVHPLTCPQCTGMLADIPDAILEYPFDTTRTIASLLYSGSLARCSDISFIFAHGGGALPMLAHRITRYVGINKSIGTRAGHNANEQLQRLYYDVVSVTQPGPFAALRALVPVSQLLFGSDYPYWPPDTSATSLVALDLSEPDLAAIEAGNALRLLKGSL
jgi:6-methylsalicylate decarboxylase